MVSRFSNVADLWHPAMFWIPETLAVSAWSEHIPFAFWLTAIHRPRKFVELGTHAGTSYFAFCQAIDRQGLSTAAYAVDTWKGDEQAGFYDESVFQRVTEVNQTKYSSFSTLIRATFDEACAYFSDGDIDLLHIDGYHAYDSVKHDFESWLPLLSDRAIVLFHDINVRRDQFGVFRLFDELSQNYSSFKFDHGHGLGVIAVGESVNDEMKRFLEAAKNESDARFIRLVFSRLGAFCSLSLSMSSLHQEYSALAADRDEKARVVDLLTGQLSDRDADIESYKERDTLFANAQKNLAEVTAEVELLREDKRQLFANQIGLEEVVHEVTAEVETLKHEKLALEDALSSLEVALLAQRASSAAAILNTEPSTSDEGISEKKKMKTTKGWLKITVSDIAVRVKYGKPNPIFDAEWYEKTYPDVAADGMDPWVHFMRYGCAEGRLPNPLFAPDWYLEQEPRIDREKVNPLLHYWREGAWTGYDPHPSFSSAFYLSEYPDVLEAGINPLQHYLMFGMAEGRRTKPSDDGQKYKRSFIRPGKGRITLDFRPVSGLLQVAEGGEIFWKMENNDPFFVSNEQIKKGIYKFVISGAEKSSLLINLKLYFDIGEGFSEKSVANLGYVQPSEQIVAFVEFPRDVKALRLDPSERRGSFHFSSIYLEKVRRLSPDWYAALRSRLSARDKDVKSQPLEVKAYVDSMHKAASAMGPVVLDDFPEIWLSIVVPIYNARTKHLEDIINSFDGQEIKGAELILVDDCSPSDETRQWLASLQNMRPDVKIILSEENGGISAATNLGLSQAEGKWVTLLDHDDVIGPYALQVIARSIQENPHARFFYTDEIQVNDDLQALDTMLKPAYDPVLLSGVNYINHFSIYLRDRLHELGGLRVGYEGSQDYDLLLRYLDSLNDAEVLHIPYPAYWWRRAGETFSMKFLERATTNARRAIKDAFSRKGLSCEVGEAISPSLHKVEFTESKRPKVSIIIPNKNSFGLMKTVLTGLFEKTDYGDFEVIVVDNGSDDDRVLSVYREYKSKYENFRYEIKVEPFNFARSINRGIGLAKGDLFLLLNNDIEVIHKEWLSEMVQCVNYQDVGIVGAKLLYPDSLIQHAGVIIGLGGLAGHWYLQKDSEFGGPLNRLHVRSSMVCVTGAAMLVTRECAEKLGDWDEDNFAVAFNDVDYCVRAYNNGYRIVWTPFACLYHHESLSRGSDETGANRLRFQKESANLKRMHRADRFLDPAINPAYSIDGSYPRVVAVDHVPEVRHWFTSANKVAYQNVKVATSAIQAN